MNEGHIVTSEKRTRQYKPSAPTVAATAGMVPAPLIIWLLSLFHVDVPAEVAASIGSFLSALFAWVTVKGRR